jgi:hypothetical protein
MILIFEIPKIAKNCWLERLGYLNLDPKTMGHTQLGTRHTWPFPPKKHKLDLVIPKKQKKHGLNITKISGLGLIFLIHSQITLW